MKHSQLSVVVVSLIARAVCPIGFLFCPEARAEIQLLADFPIGENESGVVVDGTTGGILLDASAGGLHLNQLGANCRWRTAGAPSRAASTMALGFAGNGFAFRSSPVTTLTDTVGIEAWVKTGNAGTNAFVLHNGRGSNGTTNGFGFYQLGNTYVGHLAGVRLVGSTPAVNGQWTHLALVTDMAAWGGTRLYVNGELNGFAPVQARTPTSTFEIGADVNTPGGTQFFANGTVDHVRVFSFTSGAFDPANDLLMPTPATSSPTVAAYFCGENDPGAVDGAVPAGGLTRDSSGNGLHLKIYGSPAYSSDAPHASTGGRSLSFNGGAIAYLASGGPALTATDRFAVSFWAKPATLNTSGAARLLFYNGTPGANGWGLFQVDNTVEVRFGGVGTPITAAIGSGWVHLALMRDSSQTGTRLFVNGVEAGTSPSVPLAPTSTMQFGGSAATPAARTFFTGHLDDVRLWTFEPGSFSSADLISTARSRYALSAIRVEAHEDNPRDPARGGNATVRQAWENDLAAAGADARWLRIEDGSGNALVDASASGTPALPVPAGVDAAANRTALAAWVGEIHAKGMPVIAWLYTGRNAVAYLQNPTWRALRRDLQPLSEHVCFNTPYGDALINYAKHAVTDLGLDGLWMDGTWWGPLNTSDPVCHCDFCKAKFKAETGYDIPYNYNWSDAAYRSWVQWRPKSFASFIERLSDAVRDAKPGATVAVNHIRRADPSAPQPFSWITGFPLDRFDADCLTSSEASSDDLDTVELISALNRGQGRGTSEVWRAFYPRDGGTQSNAEMILRQGLGTSVAGGVTAFGVGLDSSALFKDAGQIASPLLKQVHAHLRTEAEPYAALLVSGATDTFHFGRSNSGTANSYTNSRVFWSGIQSWFHGLSKAHTAPEIVYDRDVTSAGLSRFRVVYATSGICLAPLAGQALIDFVRGGGTLVLGPGAGELDNVGASASPNPVESVFGLTWGTLPARDGADFAHHTFLWNPDNSLAYIHGSYVPPVFGGGWAPLCTFNSENVIAFKDFGSGRVYACGIAPFKSVPPYVSFSALYADKDGASDVVVTTERAKTGANSFKITDSSLALLEKYPRMKGSFPAVRADAGFAGGVAQCDLYLTSDAVAIFEIGGSDHTGSTPGILLSAGGYMWVNSRRLGSIFTGTPVNKWCNVRIEWTFASSASTSGTYKVDVTWSGGSASSGWVSHPTAGFRSADEVRIIADKDRDASFFADNILCQSKDAGGTLATVLSEDAENANALADQSNLIKLLANHIAAFARPPVWFPDTPGHIRSGVLDAGQGRRLVHLFNRKATRANDWGQATGPQINVECGFPVQSAKLALSGTPVAVTPGAGGVTTMTLPPFGMYDVLEIQGDAPAPSVPDSPTTVSATANGARRIDLTWSDDAINETGYLIERSTDPLNGFVQVGSAAAGATTWTDTSVAANTRYYYRVSATNAGGPSPAGPGQTAFTWKLIEQWRMDHFGTKTNAGNAADANDFDRDGMPNLLEYATGTLPTQALSVSPPGVLVDGDELVISYSRDVDKTDVLLSAEWSDGLSGSWNTGGILDAPVSTENSIEQREASVPMDNQPRRFLRLRAVSVP